jgi:hypothetical protein
MVNLNALSTVPMSSGYVSPECGGSPLDHLFQGRAVLQRGDLQLLDRLAALRRTDVVEEIGVDVSAVGDVVGPL